jgi:hypothetical protein
MPTLDEIKARCLEIQVKRTAELFDVKQLLADKAVELAVSLSEWRWKDVRHYLVCLSNQLASFNPETYAPTILNSSRSIGFCKPDCSELKDSWYYTNLLELFNSVQV